jgi:hypothetical protein
VGLFSTDKKLIAAAESLANSAERIANWLAAISETLTDVELNLEAAGVDLEGIRHLLNRPGFLKLVPLSERLENDMKVILYKVVLPTEVDATTVNRELSVQVGDNPADVHQVPVDQAEVTDLEGPVDTPVCLSLVDVDDVGNRSIPSTLNVVLADTFPPQQPGEMSVVATGEKQV